MIRLIVEPSTPPLSWNEFLKSMPRRSIALDGYVKTGPKFNMKGPFKNFNHHENVPRLETRATCAQVLVSIRQGLFDSFQDERGNPDCILYVNDCDEDVSLSVFLMRNHNLVNGVMNPLLNKLVFMEDMLDTTAGAYPFPKDLESLQQLMWVFRPYHKFRVEGGLGKRNPVEFEEVIDDIGMRIAKYAVGESEKIELDTRFEVLQSSEYFSVVKEIGPNARIGVFSSGVKAFISIRKRSDTIWDYTLGRTSLMIPFNIPKILRKCNQVEGNKNDLWGGSDIVAGSPRIGGSKIPPDKLVRIAAECRV